ncbi:MULTISPECIES: ABC-three component system protein [unclassified Caulobacter]|uniref:ABC-three component system protein n=1 Tax=unclassified Caulobacter TaxID=2648921 RepID=UPI0018EE600F|nr:MULTISPECIES: ABC-three component system protein [unclassified Caulobacter]
MNEIEGLTTLAVPTPWPGANARLLGLGMGLPVKPLDRLAQFSANDFERFTLEWASGYLTDKLPGVYEVQQRGGAGDKGRDIVVWLDSPDKIPRRWHLYQCKHYDARLGAGVAAAEIAKVLYYTLHGAFTRPEEYWFVTHKGVTGPFQDMLDDPKKLRIFILDNWDKHCATEITSKNKVDLSPELKSHIEAFPFYIFRAKQPQALLDEHAQTPRYHLPVFGLPLIERPKPPVPPSSVAATETVYIGQLLAAISAHLGAPITNADDVTDTPLRRLFDRSRITFYCAEGLKELARDQMADAAFFDTLLDEFGDGLYHVYSDDPPGLQRLKATVKAAQEIQLGGHILADHVKANDREGMCHHLANEARLTWCVT